MPATVKRKCHSTAGTPLTGRLAAGHTGRPSEGHHSISSHLCQHLFSLHRSLFPFMHSSSRMLPAVLAPPMPPTGQRHATLSHGTLLWAARGCACTAVGRVPHAFSHSSCIACAGRLTACFQLCLAPPHASHGSKACNTEPWNFIMGGARLCVHRCRTSATCLLSFIMHCMRWAPKCMLPAVLGPPPCLPRVKGMQH